MGHKALFSSTPVSATSSPIVYINRHSGKEETEKVFGEWAVRHVYETRRGNAALHILWKRALASGVYGRLMDRAASAEKIAPFIERYGLDMSQFEAPAGGYATFNDFFYRKLKPGARPLAPGATTAVFPADGRHLGFQDVSKAPAIYAKGQSFDLAALLGDADLAKKYEHGSLVCSRLCPVDYHRFHFPAAGTPTAPRLINGFLYSVNPIALRRKLAYLWQNKRKVVTLRTETFGDVLLIPIGATNVGGIVETYTPGKPLAKGDEMGYFRFGGSFVATLFLPGKIRLADDLIAATASGKELYARMGSALGEAL